jgi:sugar O-acyltransferase (sialic acid O-acetyltransferase NeuD family)
MESDLYIFGNGEIAEMSKYYFENDSKYSIKAFVVDDEYFDSDLFLGKPTLRWSEFQGLAAKSPVNMHIALSYKGMNSQRHRVFTKVSNTKGIKLCSYISSRSYLAKDVAVGENVFILEGQVIQNRVSVGHNVMLWSGNHIGHGTRIGESTYISSHVVISGHTKIGSRCFFGVNSSTRDFVNVGNDCFIAMSASVLNDMPNSAALMPFQSPLFEGEKALRIMQRATSGEIRE